MVTVALVVVVVVVVPAYLDRVVFPVVEEASVVTVVRVATTAMPMILLVAVAAVRDWGVQFLYAVVPLTWLTADF